MGGAYHSSDSTFSSKTQATRTLSHPEAKKSQTCRSIPVMNRDVQLRRAKSSATLILAELVAMMVKPCDDSNRHTDSVRSIPLACCCCCK
jgi:hypothetical protein